MDKTQKTVFFAKKALFLNNFAEKFL
jgi:hypothetical protein